MRTPYYTNSSQIPVGYTDDLFEAIRLQEPLQTKYTGGTSFHAFIGEKLSKDNVKQVIKRVFEKSRMPYLSLTPTFSVCEDCGYHAGEHFKCPKCDKECQVYSRIVGYITPIKGWNKGKSEEYKQRKLYSADKIKTG